MTENFADRLQGAVDQKQSCLVVGLDPAVERLPPEVVARVRAAAGESGWTGQAAAAVSLYFREVIDRVADHAAAVKPNTAFFERFGPAGWDVLCRICEKAKSRGLLVISDAKRGDIGHTAGAYADAILGDIPDTLGVSSDAITVSPYLGSDGIDPFCERARDFGKGLFVLVRTSNPSASDFQELQTESGPLYEVVARSVGAWGEDLIGDCGLSSVGAVVGATAPEQGARIRELLPKTPFLVPGYGAQGAGAEQLRPMFLPDGRGVVVNASRSVLYAFEKSDAPWGEAIEQAAREAREDLERIRSET